MRFIPAILLIMALFICLPAAKADSSSLLLGPMPVFGLQNSQVQSDLDLSPDQAAQMQNASDTMFMALITIRSSMHLDTLNMTSIRHKGEDKAVNDVDLASASCLSALTSAQFKKYLRLSLKDSGGLVILTTADSVSSSLPSDSLKSLQKIRRGFIIAILQARGDDTKIQDICHQAVAKINASFDNQTIGTLKSAFLK